MIDMNIIYESGGVSLSLSLFALMLISLTYFYIRNKVQRTVILCLTCITIFYLYSSMYIEPTIADSSGILFYIFKAVTDLFCAIFFMVYFIEREEQNHKIFPLSKYLSYIFWCLFALNVISAIEFPTAYSIVHNMYAYISVLLNILQIVILSKGGQIYVSRRKNRRSNIFHVNNRTIFGGFNVRIFHSPVIDKEKHAQESKKTWHG